MTDTDSTLDPVQAAIFDLAAATSCRCGPAWTGRGRHTPECRHHLAEHVQTIAAELDRLAAVRRWATGRLMANWTVFPDDYAAGATAAVTQVAELVGVDDVCGAIGGYLTGRGRLACVQPEGHAGKHRTITGTTWGAA